MDGVGAATLLRVNKVLVQNTLRCIFFLSGAVGEQTFFLVDDQEVFVLINNVQPGVLEPFFGGGLADFHYHARFKGEIELGRTLAVDRNDLVGQHALHLAATDAVQFLHQEVHQL